MHATNCAPRLTPADKAALRDLVAPLVRLRVGSLSYQAAADVHSAFVVDRHGCVVLSAHRDARSYAVCGSDGQLIKRGASLRAVVNAYLRRAA